MEIFETRDRVTPQQFESLADELLVEAVLIEGTLAETSLAPGDLVAAARACIEPRTLAATLLRGAALALRTLPDFADGQRPGRPAVANDDADAIASQ